MNTKSMMFVLMMISLGLNAQSDKQVALKKEHTIIKALVDKNWSGSGVLMGNEATFMMNWQRVLDDRFIKLEFQNSQKLSDDTYWVFEATAFYKIVNDTTVVGNWFDNRGMTFPLKGSVNENELIILWGNDETEKGKTIYTNTDSNTITVEDFVMKDGDYLKFGSATYKEKD